MCLSQPSMFYTNGFGELIIQHSCNMKNGTRAMTKMENYENLSLKFTDSVTPHITSN